MKHINLFSTQSEYDNAKLSYPNVSYIEETEKVLLVEKLLPKNNQIFYTTSDGNIVEPYSATSIGTLVSNTYEDGLGVMTFASDVTSIGNQAFYGCTSLTSIELPNDLTSIGNIAFRDCTSLTSINIPSSVTSIGNQAFYGCSGLTNITIPSGVTSIGNSAFMNCTRLTSITIPSSVTSIGDFTFDGCTSLRNITIPSGVTSIGAFTFTNCYGLTTVTIPSGVNNIGQQAFSKSRNLTNIYYNGTSEQFTAITKGDSWKLNVPTTCIVHCTDGDFPITQFA